MLHTLEDGGYVVRLGHGCFGLGGKVTSLSRLFQESLDVVRTLRPAIKRLAVEAGGGHLPRALPGRRDRGRGGGGGIQRRCTSEGLEVGFSRVAHGTALGKVLLAACPDETIDDYLGQQQLQAFTPHTLVRRRDIKSNLNAVRETGVGHDLEELAVGCCCVAAPVRDARGAVVGSVGLSTPTDRWRREEARLTRLCVSAAAQASRSLAPPVPV